MIGMEVKEVISGDFFEVVSEPFITSEEDHTYTAENPNLPYVTETKKMHSIVLVSKVRNIFRKVSLNVFVNDYVKVEDES